MIDKKVAVVIGATGLIGGAVCDTLLQNNFELDQQWLTPDRPDCTKASSYNNLPPKIDAAIYLAGVNHVASAENLTEEQWDNVINVNLKGAFLFFQAALSGLKAAEKSTLICMSSIMVTNPYPERLPYSASKAALEGVVRSLAVEWGPYGVATHAIRLGHVSGLMKSTRTNPLLLDSVKKKSPLGKLIEPMEIASYILWLVQGGCHSMSGSISDFNPAYTINRWPIE